MGKRLGLKETPNGNGYKRSKYQQAKIANAPCRSPSFDARRTQNLDTHRRRLPIAQDLDAMPTLYAGENQRQKERETNEQPVPENSGTSHTEHATTMG